MTPNDNAALSKLTLATQRLLDEYPLLGGVAARWTPIQGGTGSIDLGHDASGFILHFCPGFVTDCPLDQLETAIHHVARHLLLGHPWMTVEEFPNRRAFSIAADLTANEDIPGTLPGDPITLEQYPHFPPHESTKQRYQRLVNELGDRDGKGESDSDGDKDGNGEGKGEGEVDHKGDGDEDSDGKGEDDVEDEGEGEGDDESENEDEDEDEGDGDGDGNGDSEGDGDGSCDEHNHWNEIAENAQLACLELKTAIEDIQGKDPELSEDEASLAEDSQTMLQGYGCEPGGGDEVFLTPTNDHTAPPWGRLLRKLVGQALHRSPSYQRAPRRFPDLLGIVPGRQARPDKPLVLAVIDTSASMEEYELNAIAGELKRLARNYQVTVVECDCVIQRVYPFRGRLDTVTGRSWPSQRPMPPLRLSPPAVGRHAASTSSRGGPFVPSSRPSASRSYPGQGQGSRRRSTPSLRGGGGTDFRPPLERAFLQKTHADVVVYFTDGDGPAPENKPHVPVIWSLTKNGESPVSWGQTVDLAIKPPGSVPKSA